jgi:transposase
VRVVGVVVAIDNYYGRRIFTVDDSTGLCIECGVEVETPGSPDAQSKEAPKTVASIAIGLKDPAAVTSPTEAPPHPYRHIEVGMVIDVKGSLRLFRDQRQIKVGKLQVVYSTSAEVQIWERIRKFRADILDHPWQLDRKVVDELRELQKAEYVAKDRRKKEKKKTKKAPDAVSEPAPSKANSLRRRAGRNAAGTNRLPEAKPYRPSKLSTNMTHADGAYDALGL